MTALHPHIQALRAEGDALLSVADVAEKDGDQRGVSQAAMTSYQHSLLLRYLSAAKHAAADTIEEHEREREARLDGVPRGE